MSSRDKPISIISPAGATFSKCRVRPRRARARSRSFCPTPAAHHRLAERRHHCAVRSLYPVEFFDTPALGKMATALDAAVNTLRLTGREPDGMIRWEMARRVLSAASEGASTPLALTEGALNGCWS